MTTEIAEVEVVCPGMLEVLSVGKGDIKLTVGGDDPDEIAKGKAIIEEMLLRGYSIYVETPKGLRRVKKFNPKQMTYVISEIEDEQPATQTEGRHGKSTGKVVETEVPVAGSKAKAIGRTAGG